MMLAMVLSLSIISSGLVLFSVWRKHLLISLLSLEYMVLGLLTVFHISTNSFTSMFMLIYLTFTACEGALGLSILVSMSRTHGDDYFSSFRLI